MKLFCLAVLASLALGIASFSLPAKAHPGPQTECFGNLCIVYVFVPTYDANDNFTGYAKVESRRFWRFGDDSLPGD